MTLHVVGQTQDGLLVIGGVYEFFSTYGLPVDIIATVFREKHLVVAWDSFYQEAAAHGVGFRSIIQRMSDVLPVQADNRLEMLRQHWTALS